MIFRLKLMKVAEKFSKLGFRNASEKTFAMGASLAAQAQQLDQDKSLQYVRDLKS